MTLPFAVPARPRPRRVTAERKPREVSEADRVAEEFCDDMDSLFVSPPEQKRSSKADGKRKRKSLAGVGTASPQKARSGRGQILPPAAVNAMKDALVSNPAKRLTTPEKIALGAAIGLELNQVTNWINNALKRVYRPWLWLREHGITNASFEEMFQERHKHLELKKHVIPRWEFAKAKGAQLTMDLLRLTNKQFATFCGSDVGTFDRFLALQKARS
mmetsp:Transcript_5132/g.5872  ORF Transcript_5132/g.5872 Transcript_5132/m.5872 type:complete len:216 (-) Transcript_5132:152-799(-)